MNAKGETVVVSVGGSIIVPDEIDTAFLRRFKECIASEVQGGRQFIIVAGGGKTARRYQKAVKELSGASQEAIDELGITAIRLNAHLLEILFAEERVAVSVNPNMDAWKPGASSDFDAIEVATEVGAKRVVNLSNIDYVYTADPKKNPDAEKIEETTWADFLALLPEKWEPGLSSPFDPIAARSAQEHAIEVAIINGASLDEFKNYLEHKPFVGTRIHG